MTGYAYKEERFHFGLISIELRSVNHRFLEMNIRIPEILRALEINLRDKIKEKVKRGKLEIVIHLHLQAEDKPIISFNHELATQLVQTLNDIDKLIDHPAPIKAIDILTWPEVMDALSIDHALIQDDLLNLFEQVIDNLIKSKKREGQALKQMIEQRVIEITQKIALVREEMPLILEAQKIRLEDKLQSLTADMDHNRLEQEMVYLAQKSDVAEELDRLDTHLNEITHTLKSHDAIGRRLDFLMQELNREANTLGSKSISSIMTRASVDMKVLIEQMREQIQNIE